MSHSPDKVRLHAALDLEAWHMRKVLGLSFVEIGVRTDTSPERARVRANRGRERVRTLAFQEVGCGPGFKSAAHKPRRFTWQDLEREMTT